MGEGKGTTKSWAGDFIACLIKPTVAVTSSLWDRAGAEVVLFYDI